MTETVSRREALVRGLALTLPTALVGGMMGAILFWVVTMIPGTTRSFGHEGELAALGYIFLFSMPASALFVWPGLLVVGFPLSWPFRRAIVRHPFIAAPILAVAGGALSTFFFNFMDRNSAFPDWGANASIGFAYAGSTAVIWVFALRRCRRWLLIEME